MIGNEYKQTDGALPRLLITAGLELAARETHIHTLTLTYKTVVSAHGNF